MRTNYSFFLDFLRLFVYTAVVGDESDMNACQQQKRCGKCVSLLPDCNWCLEEASDIVVCSF